MVPTALVIEWTFVVNEEDHVHYDLHNEDILRPSMVSFFLALNCPRTKKFCNFDWVRLVLAGSIFYLQKVHIRLSLTNYFPFLWKRHFTLSVPSNS